MTWSQAEVEAGRSQHMHTSAQRETEIILRPLLMTHKDGASVHPQCVECLSVCVCVRLALWRVLIILQGYKRFFRRARK